MSKILVTGGMGFIGTNLIKFLINKKQTNVLVLDKVTYAANINSHQDLVKNDFYKFVKVDICDVSALRNAILQYKPDKIMHLAAESHVDNSINSPGAFIYSNIIGTYNLLKVSLEYYSQLDDSQSKGFRFHHISTDEVYGSLKDTEDSFNEKNQYNPNSPYSASKASSDHLVRAWNKTYKLPTIITNCSNNYGPFQHPEKLIPVIIKHALEHKDIPVYGNGLQIRDWLHVNDHVDALYCVLNKGIIGETYNIGANNEVKNIELINTICELIDQIKPSKKLNTYKSLIKHVEDRKGHDIRYAINSSKVNNNLDWYPKINFKDGIVDTIKWYLENNNWLKDFK